MKVACPACHAEFSLDVLFAREEASAALARLVAVSLPFGALVLRYIGLFRPAKRRLAIERTVSLIEALLPDIERMTVTRKGRDWAAPPEVWVAAIEAVIAARDKGTLTLPLTSHGYLYEVVSAVADKAEAVAERETEEHRRQHRSAGVAPAAPVAVASALAGVAEAAHAVPPYVRGSGPSKAAVQIQAQIKAQMEARVQRRAEPGETPSTEPLADPTAGA